MRSLRIAICTSGEPVSDLWARLLEMICCLRSVASAISRVTAPCLLFITIYYTSRIPQDGMPEVGYWRPGARGRESRPVEQRTQLGMPPFVLSPIGGIGLVPPSGRRSGVGTFRLGSTNKIGVALHFEGFLFFDLWAWAAPFPGSAPHQKTKLSRVKYSVVKER